MFVKLDCNNFLLFNYVKNKNRKKLNKQTNKKTTHPYLVLASVCNFSSRSEGKKWLLGFCLFFEDDWTYVKKKKKKHSEN